MKLNKAEMYDILNVLHWVVDAETDGGKDMEQCAIFAQEIALIVKIENEINNMKKLIKKYGQSLINLVVKIDDLTIEEIKDCEYLEDRIETYIEWSSIGSDNN